MIELGGNITLEGFDHLDSAEILVAKKLVGSYVRTMCDEAGCEQAIIKLKDGTQYSICVKVKVKTGEKSSQAEKENLFIAIDAALKNMLAQLHLKE